jgi:two-component system, OmpR family, phosphate regulon response regulator PhoB
VSKSPLDGRRILIIDDSADYQRVLERILTSAGYKVSACKSAEEAWQAINVRRPDAALVDWNLPGATGVEFARRVRADARFQRMIMIMLTVNSDLQYQLKGIKEGGVNAFLTKPFSPDELLARLDGFLRRKETLT